MSEVTKEILAELGLFGQTLPRHLHIPKMTSPPATDLLNIQFTVMDMLVDDPEISAVVANHWNLALEIRAFNVQKQVWDILELDANIELPSRASIQVIVKNNEPVMAQPLPEPEPVFTASKRDPRRKQSTPVPAPAPVQESKVVSKRDPRRKYRDTEISSESFGRFGEVEKVIQDVSKPFVPSRRDPRKRSQAVVAELEAAKTVLNPQDVVRQVAKPIVNKEPNIKNLSKNDPRRKRLLEKSKAHSSTPLSPPKSSSPAVKPAEIQSKHKVHSKNVEHDSDSDEGNLQIDESFDEKFSRHTPVTMTPYVPLKKHSEPVRISESQLAESNERNIESKVGVEDIGLWDEIYGVTSEKDSSLNIYDPNPVNTKPSSSVRQLAKTIGLETLSEKRSAHFSPERVVNISSEGELKISVSPEKRKNTAQFYGEDLTIDLTDCSNEIEIIKSEAEKKENRKSIEQLERERELLLNLVKERDRMNEIVASIPLPDDIIIDKEIEDGELSDTPDNSETEHGTYLRKAKDDFDSPESPKGLQIDMDTEESEIDIIPLEREEVLLKHKKNVSKRKPAIVVADEDSDIEEIPFDIPVKGISRTKRKVSDMGEIEDPDKYKKYWEDFPEEVQDKSIKKLDSDLKSGLKKLSDIKSKEKSCKNSSPNWALKSVVKTLNDSKSEETVPSQNFWKGTSGLSSYSEKIRQKVQERMSSKEKDQQIVENPFFKANETGVRDDLSEISLPVEGIKPAPVHPPMRKGVALLNTPEFPPPVKSVPNLPKPVTKSTLPQSSSSSSEKSIIPPPPVPGVFNSSIPPPVASFGFPPPAKASFPAPPPLLLPSFPPHNTAFPPPLSGSGFPPFNSPPPVLESNKFGSFDNSHGHSTAELKPHLKVPSLLEMNIPRPSSMEPEAKQKGSAWLDPMLPQGRQGSASGARHDSNRDERGRLSRDRNSSDRDSYRRRSRSRDRRSGERSRRRSGDRDKRGSEKDRRRRRSRTRSRSRDRRRPRDERRGSQDSSSSQDSGIKRDRVAATTKERGVDKKNLPSTSLPVVENKNEESITADRRIQEDRDNVMLCFYEGEDCMDDPGDPDLSEGQSTKKNQDKNVPEANLVTEPQSVSTPGPSFGLASCLSGLMEDRESKQLFPEPVPAISAGGVKSVPGVSAETPPDTASPAPPAPPAPPSISGNAPPSRGEIYSASLGLADKHPVSAVYEYSNRMKYPKPGFEERWGPGGGWAFAVTLGPNTYSSPWFKPKKRDAKMEACRYALQQLGIFNKIM